MKKLLLASGMALALFGCKTDLETTVTVSQLSSPTPTEILSDLNVEVIDCRDFEDSRKESESLVQVKSEIAKILPKATFVECYSKELQSYAHFKTPVIAGLLKKGQTYDPSSFYLAEQLNSQFALYIVIPEELKAKIEKAKQTDDLGIGIGDLSIKINLVNDTDGDYVYFPLAAYLNGNPVVLSADLTLKKGKKVQIKLSDVSVASALYKGRLTTEILRRPTPKPATAK